MIRRIIVDKDDAVLGAKTRDELDLSRDIYRVAAVWLINSQGEVLIAQRALSLRNGAGLWGPSAAGTVEEGESYDANALKELNEELGVSGITLEKGMKYFADGQRKYFCQFYLGGTDKPATAFELQADEVAAVKWVTIDALRADLHARPEYYLPTMGSA